MELDDVRAYARRAWRLQAQLEREHWLRERAERGALSTFEASQALWTHMRRVRPDWPTEADRRADLAHHLALKRALERAASAVAATARR
jgi:hypothetical protein